MSTNAHIAATKKELVDEIVRIGNTTGQERQMGNAVILRNTKLLNAIRRLDVLRQWAADRGYTATEAQVSDALFIEDPGDGDWTRAYTEITRLVVGSGEEDIRGTVGPLNFWEASDEWSPRLEAIVLLKYSPDEIAKSAQLAGYVPALREADSKGNALYEQVMGEALTR